MKKCTKKVLKIGKNLDIINITTNDIQSWVKEYGFTLCVEKMCNKDNYEDMENILNPYFWCAYIKELRFINKPENAIGQGDSIDKAIFDLCDTMSANWINYRRIGSRKLSQMKVPHLIHTNLIESVDTDLLSYYNRQNKRVAEFLKKNKKS